MPPLCAVCGHTTAIYTCPRCALKSCSLACSSSHKSATGCSGVRDKAAYIPMNKYNWGTLMDDYSFLEDVGRKVGDWGRDITRNVQSSSKQRRGKPAADALSLLKLHLGSLDIEMELLPPGMERHLKNKSSWNRNAQMICLSIEFIFHPPRYLIAPSTKPFVLLTHANNIRTPLRDLVLGQAKSKMKKFGKDVPWLSSFLGLTTTDNDTEDPNPSQLLCLMKRAASEAPTARAPQNAYYNLAWDQPLQNLLKRKPFVEFPVIEIVDRDAFTGILVDERGDEQFTVGEEDRRPLKRKLDTMAGKKEIKNLLGDYGSDDDGDEDGGGPQEDLKANALDELDAYSDEDEDMDAVDILAGGDTVTGVCRMDSTPYEEELDWGDDFEAEIQEDEAQLATILETVQNRSANG